MRLGVVIPAYGPRSRGGTEHWIRQLCEQLAARPGWSVEVFTTTATSAVTWGDDLPAGETTEAGVTVHRHRARSGRSTTYAPLDRVIRAAPAHVPVPLARRFVEAVGPVCPEVVDEAAASGCDLVAVAPYVFWPAYATTRALGRRVVFHGAAHDEPELELSPTAAMYRRVGGFAFNSWAERALVERHFPLGDRPAEVIGNAVVEVDGDEAGARERLGLEPDEPFVLCLGRVERNKGAHALVDLWTTYRSRRPSAPRLVLVGRVAEPLPATPDVVVAGLVSESVKWGALRAADLLISPSAWESFSLVVLEAWLAGTPVLVNERCAATVEHCVRSGGGVWFGGYADFEVAVDRFLTDPNLRARVAGAGGTYARATFGWDALIARYAALTERILARAG